MSKYLKIYEALCPDDPLARDDPRRPAILDEMRTVVKALTVDEAVRVIDWWQAWPNPHFQSAADFVREARELATAR